MISGVAATFYRWNSANMPDNSGVSQGEALTVAGPPPPPAAVASGRGTILDQPNMLWCEDVWSAERESAAAALTSSASQGQILGEAMARRYEREAKRNWDLFYRRNGTNFFKDRHYLDSVFPELRAPLAALEKGSEGREKDPPSTDGEDDSNSSPSASTRAHDGVLPASRLQAMDTAEVPSDWRCPIANTRAARG